MSRAVVVGSGPNGLTAAVMLAAAGLSVTVMESRSTLGGGTRTEELTLPGYRHDVCSSVYPLGIASPVLRTMDLARLGLEWVQPSLALAHPFDDGSAAFLHSSLEESARALGSDRRRWRNLFRPWVRQWDAVAATWLGPLSLRAARPGFLPLGVTGLQSSALLCRTWFHTPRARALFTGLAAHSMAPLEGPGSAAFGLVLGALAHVGGWPFARGGARAIPAALHALGRELDIRFRTDSPVTQWRQLEAYPIRLLDTGPHQAAQLLESTLGERTGRRLRAYRYGLGVCKVDFALREPVPWTAPECRQAGTLHLGGSHEEMAGALTQAWRGEVADRPLVLAAQPSLFDATRAPAGRHVLWAYCHVPFNCAEDVSDRIEAQIERFAPGFRDIVLRRHVRTAQTWFRYNPNYVGGDINGGVQDWRQLWRRPIAWRDPYCLDPAGIYLCSSSTPPGGGVHGMCGFHAARSALGRHQALDWTLADLKQALRSS